MKAVVSIGALNHGYNGRTTLLIILSCFMASSGGFILGYDLGISGGVTSISAFLQKFFPDVYKRMKEKSHAINHCGRSCVSHWFSPSNLSMVIFSRILLGVGLGFTNLAVPLYISEVALPKHRGKMSALFGAGITTGMLGATVTNFGTVKSHGGWGWRVSLAMPAVPAAILTLCALFLPETPNSLMLNSKNHSKARHVLEHLRGTTDVEVEFDDIIKARSSSEETSFQFKKIMLRQYRPQLVMAVVLPIWQQLTGIDIITFYSPILFRTIGQGETDSLMLSVVVRIVDTFSLSWGPLTFLISNEIYPLEVRSTLQSITVAVLFFLNFALGQSFLAMLCKMKSGTFFFFGGWLVVGTAFVYSFLPETKHVPIEQMEKVWNEHWFWRRFSQVDVEEAPGSA